MRLELDGAVSNECIPDSVPLTLQKSAEEIKAIMRSHVPDEASQAIPLPKIASQGEGKGEGVPHNQKVFFFSWNPLFDGLVRDVRTRLPLYISDYKDGICLFFTI